MTKIIQSSFSRGEVAAALYGRVDLRAYHTALRQARNVIIHQFGGVSNRPGTMFVGPVKDHTTTPRLIPFQFKTTDTHVLEFGHEYIRIIRNDAHVTEDAVNITGATQADPVVVTATAHGYSNGDEVFITGVGGMTEITERRWLVSNVTANTFSLQDQVTGDDLDGTAFTAYTSGGTVSRIYTVTTPYQSSELRQLKFVQTADIVTISHPNHAPRELRRLGLNNWELVLITFLPNISAPTNVAASGGTGANAKYKVTAISSEEEESLSGTGSATATITGITNADPAVVTATAHGFSNGDEVEITGVVGMTELNSKRFIVAGATANTFELLGIDSTDFNTYTSGGTVTACFVSHTDDTGVTVSWTSVSGASRYRVFKLDSGVYGFIASTEATSFIDDGTIIPDLGDAPPRFFDPFFGNDNAPGAVGFYQQRRVFGGSNNKPDTSYFSVIGAYDNFSHAVPFKADDGFSARLTSREVNEIRHYVSLNDLLIFTSGEEWRVNATGDARFSIDTINQKPQSNWGSTHLPPIVIGSTVLFCSGVGNSVRSTSFSLENDSFTSQEVSLLVPHMFRNRTITEWGFAKRPDPITYMIRSDGQALTFTFNEEQEVLAWTTWDTAGYYESVAVVRPTITSANEQAFFVTQRSINGETVRYIERTVDRSFEDVRDCFFVDCGLSYDYPLDIESITQANPAVLTVTAHGFSNGDFVDIFNCSWQPTAASDGNFNIPTDLNGFRYKVANATANTFTLQSIEDGSDIDGTEFATYLGEGTVRLAVIELSGLWFLPNTPVTILADGNVISNLTVAANGTLTLPRRFSRIHVGLPYISDIETLNPEPSERETIQGRKQMIPYVTVRFERSRGLLIGPDILRLQEMKQRKFEVMGAPTDLLTGDSEPIHLRPDWNTNGRLVLRQIYPLPFTVLAIIPDIEVGER